MSRFKSIVSKLKKENSHGRCLINCPLKERVTYKCGGNARILLEINTLENFVGVMSVLEEYNLSYYVLGCGSNLLVSDKGYDGVVIVLGGDFCRIEVVEDSVIECGGGVRLASAYSFALSMGLGGLEDGGGIPASIGGAVCMNAGAYDLEMSKVVEYVVAYHDEKIIYLTHDECEFGYRSSVFQSGQYVIMRVGLRLTKKPQEEIRERHASVMTKRWLTQPLNQMSAGCVFRRMEGINVSKLLDDCGLKGLKLGGAQVSTKHVNFVINNGDATSQDIYEIIEIMNRRIYNRFGIKLIREIELLGDFDEVTW